ncbi:MAG TPA: hypothetical protein VL328_06685 [Gemmatimonadaceae bacterium]|nr:hypothetical protein [Gemmatimonadaceae bacterium]
MREQANGARGVGRGKGRTARESPAHRVERHGAWGAALAAATFALAGCAKTPVPAAAPPAPTPSAPALMPAGLNQPENLVYDSVADVFLVSNMGGGGSTHDDNGFISRVDPAGRVLELRWIAGGADGVQLDAPKGLAIRGDTLAVADLGAVRLFDRRTGAPIRSIALPGLVMNDVAFGRDGSIWITDTGPARTPAPVDTTHDLDALWEVSPSGTVRAVARGLPLSRPDGLVLDGSDALIATFGANRIERVHGGSEQGRTIVQVMPGGRLDGLRRLRDGTLLVSSWDAQTVWSLVPGRPPRALLTGVVSPAGIAVDTRRQRMAVTSMERNALYVVPLGQRPDAAS